MTMVRASRRWRGSDVRRGGVRRGNAIYIQEKESETLSQTLHASVMGDQRNAGAVLALSVARSEQTGAPAGPVSTWETRQEPPQPSLARDVLRIRAQLAEPSLFWAKGIFRTERQRCRKLRPLIPYEFTPVCAHALRAEN